MTMLEAFVKERNEALFSLDRKKIEAYRQDCPKKAISAGQNRNLFVFAANLRFLRLLEN